MKILKFGNVTMRGDDLHVSGFTFDCEGKSYNYNERNIAAIEAIIAFLAAELSLIPPSIDYANMEACCFKTDAVDAIAPPVAAGSVDTEELIAGLRRQYKRALDAALYEQQRAEKAEAEVAAMKVLVHRFWTGQYFDGVTKGDAAEINEALK